MQRPSEQSEPLCQGLQIPTNLFVTIICWLQIRNWHGGVVDDLTYMLDHSPPWERGVRSSEPCKISSRQCAEKSLTVWKAAPR